MLDGSLKGIIKIMMDFFGPEKVKVMIDNNYTPISSVYFHMHSIPDYRDYEKRGISETDITKVKRLARSPFFAKIMQLMEAGRGFAMKVDPSLVAFKINPEWLKKKGLERCPEIVKVVEEKGEAGQRWLELVSLEMILYLTGRLVWDEKHKCMVRIG